MFLITPQLFLSCDNLLHLFTAVEVLAGLGAVLSLLLLLGDRLHNLQEQLQPFLVAYKALCISPNNRERFSNENRSLIFIWAQGLTKSVKAGVLAVLHCVSRHCTVLTVVDTQTKYICVKNPNKISYFAMSSSTARLSNATAAPSFSLIFPLLSSTFDVSPTSFYHSSIINCFSRNFILATARTDCRAVGLRSLSYLVQQKWPER